MTFKPATRLAVAAYALPSPAMAHVKWFCTVVDPTVPPRALAQVLSPTFLLYAGGFLFLVFAGVCADGMIEQYLPWTLSTDGALRRLEEWVVRIGIGAYCLSLAGHLAVVPWGHAGSILTPELLDGDRLVGALQIAIGILVLSRRTCGIAAAGLLALIAVGIAQYGIFHMTDYVYFAGLAAYLGATATNSPTLHRWRLPVLGASLGFSLMWTAVEKFLYPAWSAQVIIEHPALSFGFPVPTVIVIAGFVEFSLAFYLIAGRGLLRVAAAALVVVFVSAMPEFGTLDIYGHLPIVAILLALMLRGTTPLHDALRLHQRSPAANAAAVCGAYLATLSALTAMYYGLQLTAARA